MAKNSKTQFQAEKRSDDAEDLKLVDGEKVEEKDEAKKSKKTA